MIDETTDLENICNSCKKKLNKLIGLEEVKEIVNKLINYLLFGLLLRLERIELLRDIS